MRELETDRYIIKCHNCGKLKICILSKLILLGKYKCDKCKKDLFFINNKIIDGDKYIIQEKNYNELYPDNELNIRIPKRRLKKHHFEN